MAKRRKDIMSGPQGEDFSAIHEQLQGIVTDCIQRPGLPSTAFKRRQLVEHINSGYSMEPALLTMLHAQFQGLQAGGQLPALQAALFLDGIAKDVFPNEKNHEASEKVIDLGKESLLIRQFCELNGLLRSRIPEDVKLPYYSRVVESFTELKEAEAGTFVFEGIFDEETNRKRMQALHSWNEWERDLSENIVSAQTGDEGELVLDFLKKEPSCGVNRHRPAYRRKYHGMSLERIDQGQLPKDDQESFKAVTLYITNLFQDTFSLDPVKNETCRLQLSELAVAPTYFKMDGEPIDRKNAKTLAQLNRWKEQFSYQCIKGGNTQFDAQARDLLKSLPHEAVFALMENIATWATRPHLFDLEFATNPDIDIEKSHPFIRDAYQAFESKTGKPFDDFTHGDDYFIEFYHSEIQPRMVTRFRQLGVSPDLIEEAKKHQDVWLQTVNIKRFRAETMSALVTDYAGEQTIQKLNSQADELAETTVELWQDMMSKGIHKLPLHNRKHILDFEEGDLAHTLGIKSVMVRRRDIDESDWELDVRFDSHLTHPSFAQIFFVGNMTSDGTFSLQTPLDEHIPGLFSYLQQLTASTFHDLAVQKKRKELGLRKSSNSGNGSQHSDGHIDRDTTPIRPTAENQVSTITIPQMAHEHHQTYRNLTHDLPPRRPTRDIERFEKPLPGIGRYVHLVEEYGRIQRAIQAERDGGTNGWEHRVKLYTDELSQLTSSLREMRVPQPSSDKLRAVPVGIVLPTITDPLTGKQIYTHTWVKDHENPKPLDGQQRTTKEEIKLVTTTGSALKALELSLKEKLAE